MVTGSTNLSFTAQKMKFFIKDFFSKCDRIRSFLRIWLHLLKRSLMENLIFRAVFRIFNTYIEKPWSTKDDMFLLFEYVHLLKNIAS